VQAFPADALSATNGPCAENEQRYNGTGSPCAKGGVRDPVWQANCPGVAPNCVFFAEFNHYWASNTYDRSQWNATATDHGHMAVLFNASGHTVTLSAANLQAWLGTSFYNTLNKIMFTCTPNASAFGTSGIALYQHVGPTDGTAVCSGGTGDVLTPGATMDFSTPLSSILGTTLPDLDGVVITQL
jgi:hypothetical protein